MPLTPDDLPPRSRGCTTRTLGTRVPFDVRRAFEVLALEDGGLTVSDRLWILVVRDLEAHGRMPGQHLRGSAPGG